MSLNSLTIETLSICTVKESIVLSDYLKPFINENDKEPSWDGFVYIYKDKNCSKENLKGRLAVQVKGKEHKDLTKEEISYSMSTVDLRNYLYDGGVILFVVYLAENGTKKKIYYCELPPIKLRILLAEAKEQQTKTIKLKQFPDDNNKKATIFLNCLENCQKQASFSNATLLSLEEIEKEGLLEGVTVPITAVGIEDPQTALLNNEVYVYAKIKGSAIPQPLEMIPMDMRTYETQAASIKIDEKQFYTQFQRVRSASSTKCILGESFVIQSENSTSPCKITYKNSNKVRVLAKDLDFMLSYLEKGYFLLNGVEMPFDYDGADLSNFNIEEQKERLQTAKDIVKLLDKITISPLLSNKSSPLSENIIFSSMERTQLSEFYKISVFDGTQTVSRVIMIPTENMPEDREKAVVSSVVNDKNCFYRYIAFLLGDNFIISALESNETSENTNAASVKHNKPIKLPALYEKML